MALRNILKGNDNPRLRKTSKPVKEINDRIIELVEDMKETLENRRRCWISGASGGRIKTRYFCG